MTTTLEMLEAQALKLSRADRSLLLERLMASLDADDDLEAAWDAVAETRESELDAGRVQGVPFEEALARLESRFPG